MFLTGIAKTVGTNVLTVLATLAVLTGGYWCWQHPESVRQFGGVLFRAGIWLGLAAALPWSSYLFMRPLLQWQAAMQSTSAAHLLSILLICGYCLADTVLAWGLNGWQLFSGALSWAVVVLGLLAAGAYNFVICESLARHVEGSP